LSRSLRVLSVKAWKCMTEHVYSKVLGEYPYGL
jgi:hypothetical protein